VTAEGEFRPTRFLSAINGKVVKNWKISRVGSAREKWRVFLALFLNVLGLFVDISNGFAILHEIDGSPSCFVWRVVAKTSLES
jgi:hypothetical protein